MHVDVRPTWRQLMVITSHFQMARTKAIYDWIFQLQPLPAYKSPYRLEYVSVEDAGAVPRPVLRSRRAREAASLHTFRNGELVRITELAKVHEWVNLKHSAYSMSGFLSKKPLNRSSALAQTCTPMQQPAARARTYGLPRRGMAALTAVHSRSRVARRAD